MVRESQAEKGGGQRGVGGKQEGTQTCVFIMS